MGFNRTSEGRVFFKNPDNDDKPQSAASGGGNGSATVPSPSASAPAASSEPVLAKDQMQMQILLLLKSLNAKLKENKEDTETIRKELQSYRDILDGLEEKAESQQANYIELEQKVSRKQNEVNKKAVRVEETVKSTIQQFSEARKLIEEIEAKSNDRDKNLETLKTEVDGYKKVEGRLAEKQKTLEEVQKEQAAKLKEQIERVRAQSEKFKEQSGKMTENIEAYVALTLRVNETETRQQALDNKIEEATSEFIKLDRKIDKALEDRNRMLRKIERIENAVMETRDALNAKAMVLLTSQGAVAGIDIPKIGDDVLQTDPVMLNRRLQEEALMPWWRKPVRLQSPVLVLLGIVVLLLGWIMGQAQNNAVVAERSKGEEKPQVISMYRSENQTEDTYGDTWQDTQARPEQEQGGRLPPVEKLPPPPSYTESVKSVELSGTQDAGTAKTESTGAPDFGITIHKGGAGEAENSAAAKTPAEELKTIDINNEKQMLEVLEADPEKLASRLNEIEPGETAEIEEIASAAPVIEREELPPAVPEKRTLSSADLQVLRSRITPDPRLPEIAKKIETQAFEGVPEAQHDMGAIYVAGHGNIKKDTGRAILWFEEAAKNGIANAKYNLAVLYHQGMGVRQDVDKAMRLYEEAAAQNHPEAQYNLGIAYIEGIGVGYNPQKAAGFFESAANRGVTEAAYNLGLIYENGLLGETRPDDALTWYKIAADKGSPEARNALEQLAQSLGIGLGDVNRIADRVRQTKMQGSLGAAEKPAAALVSEIQSELIRHGFYSGDIDGVMGPMTANSIRRYQTSARLPVDGRATPELLSAMRGTSSSYN